MDNKLSKAYEMEREIVKEYRAAAAMNDENGMEIARHAHVAFMDRIKAEGKDFELVYSLYDEAQERGNAYIDLNRTIWDKDIANIVHCFREYGIEQFTITCGQSRIADTVWMFTECGCKLEGLIEINGCCHEFGSDKYEKAHGFLLSVN